MWKSEQTAGQANQPGKSTILPDLKENGRFLSLVIIYLADQVVPAVLLYAAAKPFGFAEFGANAAKSWEGFLRLAREIRIGGERSPRETRPLPKPGADNRNVVGS